MSENAIVAAVEALPLEDRVVVVGQLAVLVGIAERDRRPVAWWVRETLELAREAEDRRRWDVAEAWTAIGAALLDRRAFLEVVSRL